jgi:tetratricopeptide (TPR) repeat protein
MQKHPKHISIARGLLVAAGMVLACAGCRTPSVSPADSPATNDVVAVRVYAHPNSKDFARALAYFGTAVSDQLNADYTGALSNFLAAIEIDPYNEELHLRAAVVYLQLNRPDDAVAIIEELIAKRPDSGNAYVWQGVMSRASGDSRKAFLAYRKAIQLDPKNSDSYKELAATYLQHEEPEKAILILERGAQRVDDPTDLLYFLGELYNHKAEIGKDPATAEQYRSAAQKTLERALEVSPDSLDILYLLSNIYIAEGQFEQAAETLQHLSELAPDNLQIKKKLALAYAATDRTAIAAEVLEEITQKSAVNPQAYLYLGELYEKLKQKEKAILNFRLATQIDPPISAPFLHLALLTMEDNPDEAVTYLRDGLLKLPDDPRLTETLAYLYMQQTNFPYAVRYFERTVQILGNINSNAITSTLSFNYALAAQYSGDHEKAATLLHAAMADDPAALSAYMHYTMLSEQTNTVADARRVLFHLLKQSPPQRKVVMTDLATLYSYDKMYDQAIKLYERVLQDAHETETTDMLTDRFHFWYGSALERTGDLEHAAEQFEQAIALNPENTSAYNYLAYMWAEKGVRLDQAKDYINIALEQEPDNGAYLDTLGWIYYMLGRYAEAEVVIARALEQLPDDPTILEHYGDVLDKLGRSDAARDYWLQALEMEPENQRLIEKTTDQPPQ